MRHDHDRPFDIEADEAADATTQFWGTTRGWAPRAPDDDVAESGWQARTTGSLQAIRAGLGAGKRRRPASRPGSVTGGIDRTRSHGIARSGAASESDPDVDAADTAQLARMRREATLGELAAGWIDENEWPEGWTAPTQRVAAVDRRLVEPTGEHTPAHASAAPRHDRQRRPDRAPTRARNHVELALDERVTADSAGPRSPIGALSERLGIGAVDPLLARLGAIVMIGVIMVPVALAARSGDASLATEVVALAPGAVGGAADASPVQAATPDAASVAVAPTTAPTQLQAATPPAQPATQSATQAAAVDPTAPVAPVVPATSAAQSGGAAPAEQASATGSGLADPATVDQPAKRVVPVCALTYEAAAGDSWYRIADGAGITPRQLLDANLAMLDTPIFPGDEICLPEGASMPTPPTTAAPATTPPSTTPATTRTPSTTVAPTTTAAPVPAPPAPTATQAEVQQLIRDIWPDELEQRALEIAYRESRYIATAFNGWCCYGVFQIYYTAHDGWLDEIGVNTASDLYDARKNITAAYTIYQRAGGWGPWGG